MRLILVLVCFLSFMLFSTFAFAGPMVPEVATAMAEPGELIRPACVWPCSVDDNTLDPAYASMAIHTDRTPPNMGDGIREVVPGSSGLIHALENMTAPGVAALFAIPV